VGEEHVVSRLEHAQPEALPLADDVELDDLDVAARDARQQQRGRRLVSGLGMWFGSGVGCEEGVGMEVGLGVRLGVR